MSIHPDAVRVLRVALKDGATIGRLIDSLVELYHGESRHLSELELVRCFECAFALDIGASIHVLIARLRGDVDQLSLGDATASIFPKILENRAEWDRVEQSQAEPAWLDSLPIDQPINIEAFQHPKFPEWDTLSHMSQLYVIRLAMSSALYSHSLQLVACLAERLQEKLASSAKFNSHP